MPRKSICFKMCFNNIKFAQEVCEVLIEINEKEWHEQLYIHKNSLGINHYAEKVYCRNKRTMLSNVRNGLLPIDRLTYR